MISLILFYVCSLFSRFSLSFLSLCLWSSFTSFDDDDDDDAEYLRSTFMKHITHTTQTQNDSLSNENALPFPRFRAHARRRHGFTVQAKVSIFTGINLRRHV